jgi:hypothetical protein
MQFKGLNAARQRTALFVFALHRIGQQIAVCRAWARDRDVPYGTIVVPNGTVVLRGMAIGVGSEGFHYGA